MNADALGATFVRTRTEADFRALYRAVTPHAFGLALRLAGGDEQEAADVVQEAWLRAVDRLDRYRSGAPFGPWLRGFVVNCWRERTRARRRAAEVELRDDVTDATSLAHAGNRWAADVAIDTRDLRRAVYALPAGFRDVLILHDIEGYTHAEIAALLGIGEGTSKSQLSRARGRLRDLLGVNAQREPVSESTEEEQHAR